MSELDRALHASVLKREEWKEKEFREQKAKHEEELQLGFGATEMTPAELRKVIDSDRRMYYRTEELNDKLYIHYKGWRKLQSLEGWTGLKALYAECNAFERIEGLTKCRSLRSLFLQENCIRKIEGLECCPDLWSLNLSSNFIERIEGLSQLKNLNTLQISKNKIGINGVDDLVELLDTNIGTIDLQDNKVWDPDVLPEVFMRMPELRVLYLKGNPCQKKIPNYRKSVTVYCTELRYLDDRPVFPEDRRAAEAFNRGGLEEERAERRRIKEEEREKHDRNMRAFNQMIENARQEKRERDAMRAEDKFTDETDPVESEERRMKRMVQKWEKENAENNKDEAQEYAERCLRSEKERQEKDGEAQQEEVKPPEKETVVENKAPEGGCNEKELDNRKLVYEDIWDDLPPAPAPAAMQAVAQAGKAPVAVSEVEPGSFEPASSFQGVRPGWCFKMGAGGLGYYRDSKQTVTKVKEDLPSDLPTLLPSAVAKEVPAERVDTSAPPPASKLKFAPPARTVAAEGAASDPASTQPPPSRGELDEMD